MTSVLDSAAHGMVLREPATRWQDALPSGNGTIGALVYGHIREELILLNHEQLWFRPPKPELPDVSEAVPELRRLLAEARYEEATEFLSRRLADKGFTGQRSAPYHPAFDLLITTETGGAFECYRRSLCFETGEASVDWQIDEHVYARRLFVSRADDVVVMSISAGCGASIGARFALRPHGLGDVGGMGSGHDVAGAAVPLAFERHVDEGWLTLIGRYTEGDASFPIAPEMVGTRFGGLAYIVSKDGVLGLGEDTLSVSEASEVLLLIGLFANEPAEEALPRLRSRLESLPLDYDALLQRHVAEHRRLYARVELDLGADTSSEDTNETLLSAAYDGHVPNAFIERMWAYGRYLLISSSRPGGWPANLQGVWNGDYRPAWSSDYHNDENIQMNYWQALPGNLAEVTWPYFDYYDSFLDDYRGNAKAVYGCRGILAPIAQSTHGMLYPGVWVNWTAGAGWLAQLYYDYWLYTGDRQFLAERALPFLEEVAAFYEDFLVEDDQGHYLFSPSLSPENRPAIPNASLVTINATMDVAIAREVLSNLCAAYEELGLETSRPARWREILAKLPSYEINEDGALREWLYPDLKDNYHHRHQSHLYPLFPGFEITREDAPRLFEAARVAVQKRLVIGLTSQSGWSLAHMANIYARLGEGDLALECLELLLRSCTGPNLFTYHNDWRAQGLTMFWGHGNRPPFQIDANLGFSAAVQEMLLGSRPGWVYLLPALPTKWARGSVEGLLCRGGVRVSVRWDMGEGEVIAVLSTPRAQRVTIRWPHPVESLSHDVEGASADDLVRIEESARGPAYRVVDLPAETTVTLRASLRPD